MTIQNTSKTRSVVVERIIGVYSVTCLQNGRIYIGSSYSVHQRIWGHQSKLRGNSHPKRDMAADFRAYGEGSFRFTIENTFATIEEARAEERKMIAEYSSSGLLYNKMLVARDSIGIVRLSLVEKSQLASIYTYAPIFAQWPSLTAFANDVGISPENARGMKLRDSIPAHCWRAVVTSATSRGFTVVTLDALATIEAGRNGLLDEGIAA